MFKAVQRGYLSPDPAVLITIVLLYGEVIKQQDEAFIKGMLPDYSRGRKVRQAASESHGGAAARARRLQLVNAFNDEILRKRSLNSLSNVRRYQLITEKYHNKRRRKKISYKTVERDLAYQKKLHEGGLSN
jgi:hypothetical protein